MTVRTTNRITNNAGRQPKSLVRSLLTDVVCFSIVLGLYVLIFDNNRTDWTRFIATRSETNKAQSPIRSRALKSVQKISHMGVVDATVNGVALVAPPPPIFVPSPIPKFVPKPLPVHHLVRTPKPILVQKRVLNGVSFYQTTVEMSDPKTYIAVGLANNASQANTQTTSSGDELFSTLVKRNGGAVTINGTFFAKDEHECVMGNMISGGKVLKYSRWENFGTTLGLKANNVPEMITANAEGQPNWTTHWFSLTCGPRLVMNGDVWLNPKLERFADDHVLGIGPRVAIGYPKSRDKLYLVTFLNGLSLPAEARMMKAIGCYDAMNLDGGASRALAQNDTILITPGRNLTNVLVVYDVKHPAPVSLIDSWMEFQHAGKIANADQYLLANQQHAWSINVRHSQAQTAPLELPRWLVGPNSRP